ncbi:MAG TPA: DUF4861 family protein [Polyangiaceae bacterium]|jgi:hypothetical protein|nr:DUF4861 family protein [Polyangiaceae bacterium]
MKELGRSASIGVALSALVAGCQADCPVIPPPAPVATLTVTPAPVASMTTTPAPAPATPAATEAVLAVVTVTNAAAAPHPHETISLSEADLKKIAPTLELARTFVTDRKGAPVLSQVVAGANGGPGELVFQTDLGPSESQDFSLRAGERKLAPTSAYKVYGRFVRERHDDFAWENDLVAHRMYGPELETTKKEPLVSSGIDVWAKKVPRLLVNEWYLTDDYHQDHGDGADFYSVGKTRGCGGLGIWANEKLFVSRNFSATRVLANGPIRLVFELDYAAWDAGGSKVSETKRVTLDAGSYFNRFESTFKTNKNPLAVALGIAKHAGGIVTADAATASMRVWEPAEKGNGNLACAVVLAPGSSGIEKQADDNFLFVTSAKSNEPLRYYVGSAWDRAGHVPTADAWGEEVKKLAARNAAAPHVTVVAGPAVSAPVASVTPSASFPVSPTPASAAPVAKPAAPAASPVAPH